MRMKESICMCFEFLKLRQKQQTVQFVCCSRCGFSPDRIRNWLTLHYHRFLIYLAERSKFCITEELSTKKVAHNSNYSGQKKVKEKKVTRLAMFFLYTAF